MNDTEEKFYKVFEIEPKRYLVDLGQWDNINNKRSPLIVPVKHKEYKKRFENNKLTPLIQIQYPPITDRILLELICIYIGYERIYMGTFELGHFRRFMLAILIDLYKEIRDVNKKERLKHQVQSLFTEEE